MKKNYASLIALLFIFLVKTNFAQCTFTSSVPYYEGFNTVTTSSPLPMCWTLTGTSPSVSVPNHNATFYYTPNGIGYFFTNGIQLYASVVYSVSMMYQTNVLGNTNWANLSILLGGTQSTTGLVSIASTPGAAVATAFTALTNTFTVGSSGIYYAAISASCNGTGAPYLTWDDFSITIPCSLNPVGFGITYSQNTVCAGTPVTLSGTGAHTYTWLSNGSTGPSGTTYSTIANANIQFNAIAQNTLSNCSQTLPITIYVNPTPSVSIISNNYTICSGITATLNAIGANTYTWSTGLSNTPALTITPVNTSTYSVIGGNQFGCTNTNSFVVTVLSAPLASVSISHSTICNGESSTFNATGANSYTWASNSSGAQGNIFIVSPNQNTTYTLLSTGSNGCVSTTTMQVKVNTCSGIKENSKSEISIFPNPIKEILSFEFKMLNANIEIINTLGEIVLQRNNFDTSQSLDVRDLKSGIYFLKIKNGSQVQIIKLIKEQ